MFVDELKQKTEHFVHCLIDAYGNDCSAELRSKYFQLIEQVSMVIETNPSADLNALRSILFTSSGIADAAQQLVGEKHSCGGLVISYGTDNYSEVLVCGNQQEIALGPNGEPTKLLVPMTENSIFDLASVTKIVTCLTVMRLHEKGIVDITKPVRYYDNRFVNIANLTLEEVLSFTPVLETSRRIDQLDQKSALDELFNVTFSTEPVPHPYSDIGAMVTKYILEAAVGESFDNIVHREVLSYVDGEYFFTDIPNHQICNTVNNNFERKIISSNYICDISTTLGSVHDPKAKVLDPDRKNLCGHSGLFATAIGMAKLSAAVLSGKIISLPTLNYIGTNRFGYCTEDGCYSQFLGLLCHTKHPLPSNSEVYELLSGNAFAIGGYTGNHYMIDSKNGLFSFFASNRCHNRITTIANSTNILRNTQGAILWPDGKNYVDNTRFAWDRDDVIHRVQYYALQLKFLDHLYSHNNSNQSCVIRKI